MSPCSSQLECASQEASVLAGGRLAVRGGAEFAFELENKREESVFRFLRCSNKGRWSYLEQGVVLA